MKTIDSIVALLLIVGGLNWGLVGLFDFDLVKAIFGEASLLTRAIYTVVGLCAAYWAVNWGPIHARIGSAAMKKAAGSA